MNQKYYEVIDTPLGKMMILANKQGICKVDFEPFESTGYSHQPNQPNILKVKQWLNRYFDKEPLTNPQFAFDLTGTLFQRKVWNALLTIPYGTTQTYKDIATKINCAGYQAVGQAISKNPISILIPCHRVIGSNNRLVGYAGGLDRKQYLLALERECHENNSKPI